MADVVVTLIGKPECHLCDMARQVVTSVIESFSHASSGDQFTLTELSILDDPALAGEYSEEIPVVLIDGRVHAIWRVDADRLRTALMEEAS